VDEGGALQSVAGPLATQIAVRQATHFVIDERHQHVQRFAVPGSPADEQLSNWGRSLVLQANAPGAGSPEVRP
jgi:hypothetical protein